MEEAGLQRRFVNSCSVWLAAGADTLFLKHPHPKLNIYSVFSLISPPSVNSTSV
jgi:hypothetical protein